MWIIGCDFHTRYQQIAMMDEASGELTEQRLDHESGEAADGAGFAVALEFSGAASLHAWCEGCAFCSRPK